MIGRTIAQYKILEELGRGGMGVVYKAEDTTLKRTVALKFLHPRAIVDDDEEDQARFMREAQAAAALDHPNICTVFEVAEAEGLMYIAMPFVEGESLKDKIVSGPLEVGEALGIAVDAARGLQAAHTKGIVHRDIKSANVMVTPGGRVQIMDFGLAKTAGATKVTRTGTTLGTAAYMSPEQATGQATDQRTDIWSLGVVLYEMLAGQLPFTGEYEPALLYSIVNESAEPLSSVNEGLPLELEQVVDRALEKDPEKRYQGTEELVEALEELRESLHLLPKRTRLQTKLIRQRRRIWGLVAAVVVVAAFVIIGSRYNWWRSEARATVAVLPCRNLNESEETAYLGDAVTHDIISQLSNIGKLAVINKLSMDRYRETEKSPGEIAAELEATHLLHPTVRSADDRVHISLELIDPGTDAVVWARSYESRIEGILSVWSEVASEVAGALGIELTLAEQELMAEAPTVDPKAYRLYQEAFQLSARAETVQQRFDLLEEAVELDPEFAPAWAELASLYATNAYVGARIGREAYVDALQKTDEMMEDAREAANRALQLDPDLAEAYSAKGIIQRRTDPVRAERDFRRAIELKPSYVWAHHYFSTLLAVQGRHEEAIAEAATAVRLNPANVRARTILGRRLVDAREYERAERELLKSIDLQPWGQTYYDLGKLYVVTKRFGEAEEAMRDLSRMWRVDSTFIDPLFMAFRGEIPAEKVFPIIQGIETRFGPEISTYLYAQLGATDQAIAALERTILMGAQSEMRLIITSPVYDPIRDDPRFVEISEKIGFVKQPAL